MARALKPSEIALVVGLSAAFGFWLWRSWQPAGPPAGSSAQRAEAKDAMALDKVPVVHMDQLEKSLVNYDAAGRDLFRYAPRPPSWADVKRMRAEAAAARKAQLEAERLARIKAEADAIRAAEAAAFALAHPAPPQPPMPPAVTFQFIGFIGPPSSRIAAFQQNDEIFLAKTGDVVKKDFKVQEIRYESVILAYTDPKFKVTRELPLSKGK
jgi:hypothetical protein